MAWLATADQRVTAESGLTRYIEEIRRVPMLEPQDEYMLAKRWREHDDLEAVHKLVNSHLRLVASNPIGAPVQWLPTKFPTQRNREFSNAYQGNFFKEQGIFTRDT
jgi:hypothetical protein